jgi:hypothetical protein
MAIAAAAATDGFLQTEAAVNCVLQHARVRRRDGQHGPRYALHMDRVPWSDLHTLGAHVLTRLFEKMSESITCELHFASAAAARMLGDDKFQHHAFHERFARAVDGALRAGQLARLEELHMVHAPLYKRVCAAFFPALAAHAPQLRVLNMTGLATFGIGSLPALCEYLVATPSLIELRLAASELSIKSTEPLAEALAANRTLEVVNICFTRSQQSDAQAGLRVRIARRLAAAFAAPHNHWRQLALPGLMIGVHGAKALLDGLADAPAAALQRLQRIDVSDMQLGVAGVKALGRLLAVAPSLIAVHAKHCAVTDMRHIAAALPAARSLRCLDLDSNVIDAASSTALVRALHDAAPQLHDVRFQYGLWNAEGLRAWIDLLHKQAAGETCARPDAMCILRVRTEQPEEISALHELFRVLSANGSSSSSSVENFSIYVDSRRNDLPLVLYNALATNRHIRVLELEFYAMWKEWDMHVAEN